MDQAGVYKNLSKGQFARSCALKDLFSRKMACTTMGDCSRTWGHAPQEDLRRLIIVIPRKTTTWEFKCRRALEIALRRAS